MINFKKYKRFFAFGCSMTSYRWPTWADIIAQEIPEYYNFGKTGAGNIFISNQIAEAHVRYNFTPQDLIIPMWSTVVREDRYVDKQWHCQGNIYNQDFYDKSFVRKYVDTRGQLIRDLGLITLSKGLLDSIGCDYHMLAMQSLQSLLSGDYPYQQNDDYSDVLQIYGKTVQALKPDIFNTACGGKWTNLSIVDESGRSGDYHPTTGVHFDYLNKVFPGIEFSENTKKFVNRYDLKVKNAKHVKELGWPVNKPNIL